MSGDFVEKFGGDIKAEWNMAVKDFERLGTLFAAADQHNVYLLLGKPVIVEMYSILKTIWMNFSYFIKEGTNLRKNIERLDKEISSNVIEYQRTKMICVNNELIGITVMKEMEMYQMLLDMKQIIGIGIPTRKKWDIGVARRKTLGGEI